MCIRDRADALTGYIVAYEMKHSAVENDFGACRCFTLVHAVILDPDLFETKCLRNFSASPTSSTRPTTGYGANSISMWVHMNLFLQLSRDGNLHGSGMSHATRQPVQNHPSGHLGHRRDRQRNIPAMCSQGPQANKTGRGSLLSRSSYSPDHPIGQGTELN